MHTLTGTSDDFASFAHAAHARGFRVAVLLRRGHLGSPLKTGRFNLLGSCADLEIHLERVTKRFPLAKVFGHAESAGTGLAVRYAGEKNTQCLFHAMVCVCPGYDTTEGGAFSRFEPFLDAHLLRSVKASFLRGANEDVFSSTETSTADVLSSPRSSDAHPCYSDLLATETMANFQRLSYKMQGNDSLRVDHDNANPVGTVITP